MSPPNPATPVHSVRLPRVCTSVYVDHTHNTVETKPFQLRSSPTSVVQYLAHPLFPQIRRASACCTIFNPIFFLVHCYLLGNDCSQQRTICSTLVLLSLLSISISLILVLEEKTILAINKYLRLTTHLGRCAYADSAFGRCRSWRR